MQLGALSLSPSGSLCARTAFTRRAEVEGKEECTFFSTLSLLTPPPLFLLLLPITPLTLRPVPASIHRAPTHMTWPDPVGTPQTAGAGPTLTVGWTKGDDCITAIAPPKPTPHQPVISSHATLDGLAAGSLKSGPYGDSPAGVQSNTLS
ncbi:hypothetical protein NQZ68_020973 [Dissostichus eleginoides]|nr:hypothetical protein NQZ68_020973 [Dissostichus eleginoides]